MLVSGNLICNIELHVILYGQVMIYLWTKLNCTGQYGAGEVERDKIGM